MTIVHDITPRITPRLAVYPGDTPPTREVLLDMRQGATVTLSTLRATVHLGAHVDAPSHYGPEGRSIEQQPLDRYIGACQVIRVAAGPRQRIVPADLGDSPIRAPRVLLATGTFPDPERWTPDFAALSVELVEHLHANGVVLVAIDTPSVDLSDSKDLPAHNAVLRRDMAILEGIVLDGVAEGLYELVALPLPLEGFDASPVRAVLRALP